MKINEFDYELPKELIAQSPRDKRDTSRLLVVDRKRNEFKEHLFYEIIEYLNPEDLIIFNNTKVIKARLFGSLPDGKSCELLLLRRLKERVWESLGRPARKIKAGCKIKIGEGEISVLDRKEEGIRIIEFISGDEWETIDKYGTVPLPPYIKNPAVALEQYQTIFAEKEGAVAAPTAGFHFTEELLKKISEKGVKIEFITLHCGLGTFRPIKSETVKEHKMHSEDFEIKESVSQAIAEAKEKGKKVIACGTTVVRTLESQAFFDGKWRVRTGTGSTDLFIYPGYQFKIIDALITNFHLPKSTLLLLICAFAPKELIFNAYRYAIEKRFRFYSFGDAMFII